MLPRFKEFMAQFRLFWLALVWLEICVGDAVRWTFWLLCEGGLETGLGIVGASGLGYLRLLLAYV